MRPRVVLVAACGAAALVAGFVIFSPAGLARLRTLEEEERSLSSEVSAARGQNARIADDVQVLRGDDKCSRLVLEKLAREDLGFLAPGEVVLVVPPASAAGRVGSEEGH